MLLTIVGFLFATAATAPGRAAAGTVGSREGTDGITIVASNAGQQYCAGDEDTFRVLIDLAIRVDNKSRRILVWPRSGSVTPISRVASTALEAAAGKWVAKFNGHEITGPRSSPPPHHGDWYMLIKPGESREIHWFAEIIAHRPNASTNVSGTVPAGGSYVLDATQRLWPLEEISRGAFERQRRRWVERGYRIFDTVRTPFIPFEVAARPDVGACSLPMPR